MCVFYSQFRCFISQNISAFINYLLLKLSFSALRARIVSTGSLWPAWACTLDSVTLDKRAILETWNGFLHKIVYPHERIDQKLLCYGWGYCGLWRRGGAHLLAPRYFINDVLIRCYVEDFKLPIQRTKTWLSGSTCLPNARFCREYSWPQNTWWHLMIICILNNDLQPEADHTLDLSALETVSVFVFVVVL